MSNMRADEARRLPSCSRVLGILSCLSWPMRMSDGRRTGQYERAGCLSEIKLGARDTPPIHNSNAFESSMGREPVISSLSRICSRNARSLLPVRYPQVLWLCAQTVFPACPYHGTRMQGRPSCPCQRPPLLLPLGPRGPPAPRDSHTPNTRRLLFFFFDVLDVIPPVRTSRKMYIRTASHRSTQPNKGQPVFVITGPPPI